MADEVIVWEEVSRSLGDDDNITITIKEIVDGVASGVYSARLHKDHKTFVATVKAMLKEKILEDRARKEDAENEAIAPIQFDYPNFETFLSDGV